MEPTKKALTCAVHGTSTMVQKVIEREKKRHDGDNQFAADGFFRVCHPILVWSFMTDFLVIPAASSQMRVRPHRRKRRRHAG